VNVPFFIFTFRQNSSNTFVKKYGVFTDKPHVLRLARTLAGTTLPLQQLQYYLVLNTWIRVKCEIFISFKKW
jgi:hypothetical protein